MALYGQIYSWYIYTGSGPGDVKASIKILQVLIFVFLSVLKAATERHWNSVSCCWGEYSVVPTTVAVRIISLCVYI